MRQIIYNNKSNIKIDKGLYFGQGVFETILYLNKPVLFKEHMERLKEAVLKIGMEPLEEDNIKNFIGNNINIKNKALKITVTPENIIISYRDIPYKKEDYLKGFNLNVSSVFRNSTSRLTYIKSTCYIENILEKQESMKKGYNDVLFLNEKGFICETSCANIFFIKNDKIFTPFSQNGLLNGIIRKWIIENYNVLEKNIKLSEINDFDEVFVSNSLVGIMPVNSINNIKFNKRNFSDSIREKYEIMTRKAGGVN